MLFNDLLLNAGIAPGDVRLLRHHTKPGLGGQSLHDLWKRDRDKFDLYQSTQEAGQPLFRTGKIWASFVSPDRRNSLFVGLYDAEFVETRIVDWKCPYSSDTPGGGKPVDVFKISLRPELSEHIEKLRVVWDPRSIRTWARYAHTAPFPVVGAAKSTRDTDEIELVGKIEDLAENLAHLEAIRADPLHADRQAYLGFVERGTCFLPYRVGSRIAFAPSRLLGYKRNNVKRHAANDGKDGRETNAAISDLLHHDPRQEAHLERSYRAFCASLGFVPRSAGSFGRPRKYWRLLEQASLLPAQRAVPHIRHFEVGRLYSRDDVADCIGLTPAQRKGAWLTGYTRASGEFYLFANVGISGRTGHDYPNRWDGKDFIWFSKSETALGQREINDLLGGDYPVHIFWRAADRAPFSYAGLGAPIEVSDTKPVQVRWTFMTVVPTHIGAPLPPSWRRGPPPVAGSHTVERLEGPTSVYLLVLEGPVAAAFPALEPGHRIVKVGLSNDVARRIEDLSSGLPPGCALRWRLVTERLFPTGREAYAVETAVLEQLRFGCKWIGGEFGKVPEAELTALISNVELRASSAGI
ncbi:DUF3427 domain-containing protein [Bosea sp. CS1GBMeth4]|uniref:DUF3427 domain-containing protein n=1 Tax=Bosea sp. CS1GBMeth4 TaxID=1892849 RepID=UPI001648114C|nr:DUF3427 domain-containing protein [Bosea sp. CS1GBMeth4]